MWKSTNPTFCGFLRCGLGILVYLWTMKIQNISHFYYISYNLIFEFQLLIMRLDNISFYFVNSLNIYIYIYVTQLLH